MHTAVNAPTIVEISAAGDFATVFKDANLNGVTFSGTAEERRALLLKWLEAELTEVEETHEEESWFKALKAKLAGWDWELSARDPGPIDLSCTFQWSDTWGTYRCRLARGHCEAHSDLINHRSVNAASIVPTPSFLRLTADGLE